jgi:hypothetical protein
MVCRQIHGRLRQSIRVHRRGTDKHADNGAARAGGCIVRDRDMGDCGAPAATQFLGRIHTFLGRIELQVVHQTCAINSNSMTNGLQQLQAASGCHPMATSSGYEWTATTARVMIALRVVIYKIRVVIFGLTGRRNIAWSAAPRPWHFWSA